MWGFMEKKENGNRNRYKLKRRTVKAIRQAVTRSCWLLVAILFCQSTIHNSIALIGTESAFVMESKEALISKFKTLCSTYPQYARFVSIGKSVQGRDIWAFCIGNRHGGCVMWDAQIHGPEDLGSEIAYMFAKWVLTNSSLVTSRILKENYLVFIPVINVDSYDRQNMRRVYDFGNGSVVNIPYGVNLNRNFPTGWGESGTSDILSSSSYRGLWAGSEPETQAMINAFRTFKPEFYVDTHMWGGPSFAYYHHLNTTKVYQVRQKLAEVAKELNVSTYPFLAGGEGGYAEAEAWHYNASAFLLEFNNASTNPTLDELNTIHYPRSTAILLTMCELSGIVFMKNQGTLDILDALRFANAFGSTLGGLRWNVMADLNGDDVVDLSDAMIFANHFGKYCP
jgi:hypothetical protein